MQVSLLNTVKLIWISFRPKQWIKNLFVLVPLLFSRNLFNYSLAWKVFLGFFFFCLLAGSVYILNDIVDIKEDKGHPERKNRPLASGKLKVSTALISMLFVLVLTLSLSFYLHWVFGLLLLGYLILNLVYTNALKHIVILDIFCIAAGFLLRVISGAVLVNIKIIEVSEWLLICTLLLALFLGFAKRRHELIVLGAGAIKHRKVLAKYDARFLDMVIGTLTASTLISYVLYTMSEQAIYTFEIDKSILTIPFVLYGIFRYLYLVYYKSKEGDPIWNILFDLPLLVAVVIWTLTSAGMLYLRG